MDTLAHRLSLRHLRLVVVIHAEGNLLRAATRLSMTQSAATKALHSRRRIFPARMMRA